jgi:predicted O-methyltransferase YrrM
MATTQIEGQLNEAERRLLTEAITQASAKPKTLVEVGTWLGGGSTLHILRALEINGVGHLWGIEANRSIYEKMVAGIHSAEPTASARFTPLFGFSQDVLTEWLPHSGARRAVDFAFLDGGNNPREQIDEFHLLEPCMPVGAQIMAHDVKLRKGRWLKPFLFSLDNWRTKLHDVSEEGLLHAVKTAAEPSSASLKSAKQQLLRLKCDPVEIAAVLIPSGMCRFILNKLPRRFARRLSDGRP